MGSCMDTWFSQASAEAVAPTRLRDLSSGSSGAAGSGTRLRASPRASHGLSLVFKGPKIRIVVRPGNALKNQKIANQKKEKNFPRGLQTFWGREAKRGGVTLLTCRSLWQNTTLDGTPLSNRSRSSAASIPSSTTSTPP